MCSDHRVNGCDRLTTHDPATKLAIVRLLMAYSTTSQCQSCEFMIGASWKDTRVQRSKPVQPLLKFRRETIISLHLAREQRVATLIRRIEDVEERRSRRLFLIRHIRVPGNGVGSRFEEIPGAVVLRATMYEMDFGVT